MLETVDVEFAEIVLGNHGQADTLIAIGLLLGGRSLRLLLRDLKLGGVEVQELGLDVFLGRLRLRRSLLLLLLLLCGLLRGGCGLGNLLLELTETERGRVGADVVKERSESRVAEKSLDEATVTLVLLEKCSVLRAKVVGILSLEGNFAFKLTNVF